MATIMKITYVSKSGTSAIAVVQRKFGPATTMVASGWLKVDAGTAVGTIINLPDTINVDTVVQQGEANPDTGEVTNFNWLVLS